MGCIGRNGRPWKRDDTDTGATTAESKAAMVRWVLIGLIALICCVAVGVVVYHKRKETGNRSFRIREKTGRTEENETQEKKHRLCLLLVLALLFCSCQTSAVKEEQASADPTVTEAAKESADDGNKEDSSEVKEDNSDKEPQYIDEEYVDEHYGTDSEKEDLSKYKKKAPRALLPKNPIPKFGYRRNRWYRGKRNKRHILQ